MAYFAAMLVTTDGALPIGELTVTSSRTNYDGALAQSTVARTHTVAAAATTRDTHVHSLAHPHMDKNTRAPALTDVSGGTHTEYNTQRSAHSTQTQTPTLASIRTTAISYATRWLRRAS